MYYTPKSKCQSQCIKYMPKHVLLLKQSMFQLLSQLNHIQVTNSTPNSLWHFEDHLTTGVGPNTATELKPSFKNRFFFREYVKRNPSQILRSWYMFFFQIPFIPELVIGNNDFQHVNDHYQGKLGKMGLQNSSNFLSDEEVEIYKYAAMRNIRYAINYYRAS